MPRRVAVLDDYQQVALACADWSSLADTEVQSFADHIDDADALVERLADCEVVVLMRERTPFPRALIERLPQLRLIVTTGARLAFEDRGMRAGAWQRTLGVGLQGKTLGVIGLGNLGSQVASVGRAFGMEVVAWSQNLTAERAEACGAQLLSKDELLARSDVVTVHLVLSARTRGLIGARELALMKPTAYLVNTSRGPIVEEAALLEALESGRIAGAGIDVFDVEPLPAEHLLRRLDNVVLTPHLGYVTRENYELFYGDAVEDIHAFQAGAPVRVIQP